MHWRGNVKIVSTFIVIIFVAACSTSDELAPPSAERCSLVREHAINMQLDTANAHGAGLSTDLLAAHRDAMRTALGDDYVERCRERGTEWTDCALRAADPSALNACGTVR